ncbi:hypothetical protein E2320_020203, partial [Naja naja]
FPITFFWSSFHSLLVGAPRQKAFPLQQANRTGGLFSCNIETPEVPCTRIKFDETADPAKESKEDQWMGVTVRSQGPGGKIVTCAHRYEKRYYVNTDQETRDIIGRCYVLSQDLSISGNEYMDGGEWSFCDGRLRGHEKFGSCQQGVAATFTSDNHYIVFGAPGTYNWKGVVRAEQKNHTLDEMGIFDDGPYEVGGESLRKETLVPVPANSYLGLLFMTSVSYANPDQFVYKTLPPSVRVDKPADLMMNSYLGFSLDSGKGIISQEEITFVSGAPRANHSGAVVLLKKDSDIQRALSSVHIFEGEGLASSFGYDVAVVDLNSDGWQDIVVGAPQYFERDGEIGGAAYVYINQEGKWDRVNPIRLNGTKDSMFGIAVENIGDVNKDGFPDIAVGAPYAKEFGKVYLYHGSRNGINTKPAQILEGERNVPFFGYSITGNMDLDGNSYPDIAVGSLSDTVSVYRSRPVISIKKSLTISPDKIDLNMENCEVSSKLCLNIRSFLDYTFEADYERKKSGLLPRVHFTKPHSVPFSGSVILKRQKMEECVISRLELEEKIKDKLRPIPVSLKIALHTPESSIKPRKRQGRSLPDLTPILNADEPDTMHSEVQFLKEGCGSDNICHSNLKMHYRFCTKEGNEDKFAYFPMENNVPVLVLKDQKEIALEITVTNNPPVTFYVILSTTKVNVDTKELDINLKLETTSNQTNLKPVTAKAKVVIELLLSLTGVAKPSQVYFGGNIIGESAMKSEHEIGSLIEYEFRITNLGKPLKTFGTAFLEIMWPKELRGGKWLLYLVSIHSKELGELQCTPQNEINFLNVQRSQNARIKREVAEKQTEGSQSFSLFRERKYKTLECNEEANCVNITCSLQGLDSKAVVVLRSRLWNSTFLEEFYKMSYLDIFVRARIGISAADNVKLANEATNVRVNVFPTKTVALYKEIPWWIILVAILAGLLMLALLVFLLWKCGFFKRDKKDHFDATYHKAEIHAQPSDKERLTSDA